MILYPFTSETYLNPDWLKDNFNIIYTTQALNLIRQLQDRSLTFSKGMIDWLGEAYTDSNGRMNLVNTATDNTTATFDTNKYKFALPIGTAPYVIISATSVTTSAFAINDCLCIPFTSGKWLVYCTVGSDEVKRAKIYKTLFYGTTGANAAIRTTNVTDITSLKTSVSRDVGKKGYYAQMVYNTDSPGGGNVQYTGTFTDTTNNTSCSSWSYLDIQGVSAGTTSTAKWYNPAATERNSVTQNGSNLVTSDETGTDLSADENNNPSTCKLEVVPTSSVDVGGTMKVIVLAYGGLTWADTGAGLTHTPSNIDFYTTHSVPAMTAATEDVSANGALIEHSVATGTFTGTVSSCIGVPLIADWETGADIQYKLTNASEDTGWLNCSNSPAISSFTAFTSEPTKCIVKLIPKSSSPTTGYPAIHGFAVIAK